MCCTSVSAILVMLMGVSLLGQRLPKRDQELVMRLRRDPSPSDLLAFKSRDGIITGVAIRTKAQDIFLAREDGLSHATGKYIWNERLFTQDAVAMYRSPGGKMDSPVLQSFSSGANVWYWNYFRGEKAPVRVRDEQPRIFFGHSGTYYKNRSLIYLVRLGNDPDYKARCLEIDASVKYDEVGGFGDFPKSDYLIPTDVVELASGVKELVPKYGLDRGEFALWVVVPSLDLTKVNMGVCIGRIYSFGID
jgi:hypothetical protein